MNSKSSSEVEPDEILEWINENIRKPQSKDPLTKSDIRSIKDFVLLWNLFESSWQARHPNNEGKSLSAGKINEFIDEKIKKFEKEDFKSIFDYFYDRYQDKKKLEKLKLSGANERIVEKVLSNEYKDKNNKMKFIMAIVHRYRNNLFHGNKNMLTIENQGNNFEHANENLKKMILISKGA